MRRISLLLLLNFFLAFFFIPSFSHASVVARSANTAIKNGLVGYWNFDGNGVINGVLRDQSGNGNNGNILNIASSTFYSSGKIGQAGNFDGINDYINVPPATSINSLTAVTACAWVYPTKSGGTTDYFQIVRKTNDSFTLGWDFYLRGTGVGSNMLGPGTSYTSDGANFTYIENTIGIVPLNSWSHVCAVQNGNGRANMSFYMNGASAASNDGNDTGTRGDDSANPLRMSSSVTSESLGGKMDEVRVYNRALSASEIRQLYNQSAGKFNVSNSSGVGSGLVAHYTFDGKDLAGGRMKDASGNNNTGYFSGIASSTFYASGKIGQAGNFDGSNDLVTVAAATSINNLTTITACAWVNPATAAPGSTFPPLVRKTNDASTLGWDIYLNLVGTNTWGLGTSFAGGGGFDYIEVDTALMVPGTWYHVCMSQNGDGSANMKLYLNGANVVANDSGDGATRAADAAQDLRIVSAGAEQYKGKLDEIRVYNRVLSAAEIKQIYNMGAETKFAVSPVNALKNGLVGYWPFDGKYTLTGSIKDISGSNFHGYATNIASSTFYTAGAMGQAISFKGGTDLVTIPQTTGALDPASITLSFWAKVPDLVTDTRIIDKTSGSYIIRKNSNIMQMISDQGCTFFSAGASKMVANKWQHWVFTADAATGCKWYVDGVFSTSDPTAWVSTSNTQDLLISSGLGQYIGQIDDLRIYNRVLSATEVNILYNEGR